MKIIFGFFYFLFSGKAFGSKSSKALDNQAWSFSEDEKRRLDDSQNY
jgi:hypothetical protein